MPLLLARAGQETVGVYAVVGQAMGYLALTDLGFSVALARYLAQANWSQDGGERLSKVMSTGRVVGAASNFAFALACAGVAYWLPDIATSSPEVLHQGRVGLAIAAGWAVVRTPLTVQAAALQATQGMVAWNGAMIAGNAARLLISLAAVSAGGGLVGLMVGGMAGDALSLGLQAWSFGRSGIRPSLSWAIPDTALLREMLIFGGKSLLLTVGYRLVYQTDSIVVGYLYGAASVSVYYLTQVPATLAYNIPLRIADSATPAIHELWVTRNMDRLRTNYVTLLRAVVAVSLLAAIGMGFFLKPLIGALFGPTQFAGQAMVLALSLFCLSVNLQHLGNAVVFASGRIGALALVALAEGVANLALSVWLGRVHGLAGVMWASALANLPVALFVHLRAHRELTLSLATSTRALSGLIVPGAVGIGIGLYAQNLCSRFPGWASLLGSSAALSAAFIGASWFFFLSPNERGRCVDWVVARTRRASL